MKLLIKLNTVIALVVGAVLSYLSGQIIMFAAAFGVCYAGIIIALVADKIVDANDKSAKTRLSANNVSHAEN